MGIDNLLIWGLCEYGVSHYSVFMLYKNGITLKDLVEKKSDKVIEMTKHQSKLISEIDDILADSGNVEILNSKISVYALTGYDLSLSIVDKIRSKNINMATLIKSDEKRFSADFEFSESSTNKIFTAYNELVNEIGNEEVMNLLGLFDEEEGSNNSHFFEKIIQEIIMEFQPINSFKLNRIFQERTYSKFPDNEVQSNLKNMLSSRMIKATSEGYINFELSLDGFVSSISNDRLKYVLKERLSGKTLEDIGKDLNVTKQMISQLLSKAIRNRPKIEEDKYKKYYENYDLTESQFCNIFNVPKEVYNFFKMEVNHGIGTFDEFMKTEELSDEERYRIKSSLLGENEVIVGGETINLRKNELINFLLKTREPAKTKIEVFTKRYNEFVIESLPSFATKLISDTRTIAGMLERSDFVIMCNDSSFRYYDYRLFNYEKLFEAINLNQYENVVISSKKFFTDYSRLIKTVEIQNQYELHYLLRRYYSKDENFNFTRMPMIEIGNISKDEFVLNEIEKKSPILIRDFLKYFAENFGYEETSFKAYLSMTFKKFINMDIIDCHQKTFSDNQIILLKKSLTQEFYSKKVLKELFEECFGFDSKEYLNPNNFELLGYRNFSTYVINEQYSSPEEYFSNYLFSHDRFSSLDITSYLKISSTFSTLLLSALESLEIVEYENGEYLNIRKLERIGINKASLKFFISDALLFAEENEFFTIKVLLNRGLKDPFIESGFDEVFLSNLILRSRELYSRKLGGVSVFMKGRRRFNNSDFFREFFDEFEKLDFYDFKILLVEKYGIKVDESKLKDYLNEAGLYYDETMDTIYKDKEKYLKEVFRDVY